MRRAEAVLLSSLTFCAGLAIGTAMHKPQRATLIPPTNYARTPPTEANRDLTRPAVAASKGLSPVADLPAPGLSPQGMIPAAPPSPHALAPAPATAPTSTAQPAGRGSPTAAQWDILRRCESGDQYGNKENVLYRGAYQIGFVEWRTYGGTGYDPADASPAEQDAVALRLWQARGWEPWASSSACSGLR